MEEKLKKLESELKAIGINSVDELNEAIKKEKLDIYGGKIFVRGMAVHRGKNVEISKVHDDAYCIKESDREWFWTDEMFEGLAEDELTAEEAIKLSVELCSNTICDQCPVLKLRRKYGNDGCFNAKREHVEEYLEILKQWKADREKKEVETEFACIVRVIEDLGDSKRCVYEEDVTGVKDETFKMTMKRILEEYCKDHEGKFSTVYEEICRVKE